MNSEHVITTDPTRAVQAAELDGPSLAELEAVEGGQCAPGPYVVRTDTYTNAALDLASMCRNIVYGLR